MHNRLKIDMEISKKSDRPNCFFATSEEGQRMGFGVWIAGSGLDGDLVLWEGFSVQVNTQPLLARYLWPDISPC